MMRGTAWLQRQNYNHVITVKLIIPSGCNAHCVFCYMNDPKMQMEYDKQAFLNNLIPSLDEILYTIGNHNPVSIDITGNEPTYDVDLLRKVLQKLRDFEISKKVCRVTMTTNGLNLLQVVPDLAGVVNYVNISVHDFRHPERIKIMGWSGLSDAQYLLRVNALAKHGITASAISVLYQPIPNFKMWRDQFIAWCEEIGFIGLRFRCDAFLQDKSFFEQYMQESMDDAQFEVLVHEQTPDSHWCRLRRFDRFRVFFLEGVLDTSEHTKGIEYVIADDGKLYADFYKRTPIEDYQFPIGEIYDRVEPRQ